MQGSKYDPKLDSTMEFLITFVVFGVLTQHCGGLERRPHPCPFRLRSDGHRVGHLEQLGCQRPPLGPVTEYLKQPTPRELWENHVKPYKPAVLRNALKGSPALELWDDRYITETYGDQEVLIEKKYEDRKTEPKRMELKDFLKHYHKHNWYVVSMLPNAMRQDIKVPKPLMCGTFRQNLAELNLWIGTNGTRSMLHHDADNILHCVVSGFKDWILFHPMNKPKLDMVVGHQGQNSGFSHLNVDSIDEDLNPEVWDAPWQYVTLRGGDCLYLPHQYLHQVRSYERTISSTFLFYPVDNFSDEDCEDVNFEEPLSLKDVYVYWTYEKGQETVDMGYCNAVSTRSSSRNAFKLSRKAKIDLKMFIYLSASEHGEPALESNTAVFRTFNDFDANGDNYLTPGELENADIEVWKCWCRATESPHGPTKSELQTNKKYSSEMAEFSPRRSDRNLDSRRALVFLNFLLRVKGHDGAITYPEFKKNVDVENGNVGDAFKILDKDFDGVLTFKELQNTTLKRLRDFSRMSYSLLGTYIKGGGLYEDDFDERHWALLSTSNEIPEELIGKPDDLKVKEEQVALMKEFLEELKRVLLKGGVLNVNSITNVAETFDFGELGTENIDFDLIFKILDTNDKGYIEAEDLDYYITNTQIDVDDDSTPINYIFTMMSSMDMVKDFENRLIEAKSEYKDFLVSQTKLYPKTEL